MHGRQGDTILLEDVLCWLLRCADFTQPNTTAGIDHEGITDTAMSQHWWERYRERRRLVEDCLLGIDDIDLDHLLAARGGGDGLWTEAAGAGDSSVGAAAEAGPWQQLFNRDDDAYGYTEDDGSDNQPAEPTSETEPGAGGDGFAIGLSRSELQRAPPVPSPARICPPPSSGVAVSAVVEGRRRGEEGTDQEELEGDIDQLVEFLIDFGRSSSSSSSDEGDD